MRVRKRVNVLAFSIVLSVTVMLSSCGMILGTGNGAAQGSPARGNRETATLMPTITPRPTSTPVAPPTTQAPRTGPEPLFVVPSTPGTPFTMEVTEEQINESLEGQVFAQNGSSIKDIRMALTDDEIIAQAKGTYQPLGLTDVGVTARGVPVVSDGKVYLRVNDVTLDSSVPVFTRFLAEFAIEQGLRQYSTSMGIEIPLENVEITSVDLQPGRAVITGRTSPLGPQRGV